MIMTKEAPHARLRQLVEAYAYSTDQKEKKRLMRLINILRERRNLKRKLLKKSTTHAHKEKIDGYCSRCHGYGMGIYRHVQGGVCFQCGRMPTIYRDDDLFCCKEESYQA
ncbi:hypothetical protein [Photobacterium rosenbergii]|uniref:hypothetical protein n=1 Tax=Photobacterium rosenbergii TaxID=294936 RepID=UPI001C996C08|nr:hypothetical protein [Photobacterium rosenbergii]MBY5944781.1 hypothetical protein [Photobacterium rosenbergii]